MAASLVGWVVARTSVLRCPWNISNTHMRRVHTAATRKDLVKTAKWLFRAMCQALIPSTKNPPSIQAPPTVCKNSRIANFWVTTSRKLDSSARPLWRTYPVGCCIQALATRIQNADMLEAMATSQMVTQWSLEDNFFQPKNHTAMKVDSRKKVTVASTASRDPKMSPTYLA